MDNPSSFFKLCFLGFKVLHFVYFSNFVFNIYAKTHLSTEKTQARQGSRVFSPKKKAHRPQGFKSQTAQRPEAHSPLIY
jgi:hypothetical protein